MTDFLRFDGVNDTVTTPNFTDTSATTLNFTFNIKTLAALPNSKVVFEVFASSTNRVFVYIFSDGRIKIEFRSGGTQVDVNSPSGTISASTEYLVNCIIDKSVNDAILEIDTVEVARTSSGSLASLALSNATVALGARTSTLHAAFDLEYFRIVEDGTTVRDLQASLANGTGSVLPDALNASNNGTLNNFPTDDSQWISTAPPFSIVDVDTDNTVTDGQQNVSLTTTGFASDITTVNLKVGADTLALTGLTGTGDNYTFDLPDVTSYTGITAGLPFSSGTYQNEIQVGDGTDTAVINITREPKAGYAVVEVTGGVATTGSIFETRSGGAPADGSQVYYPTADTTSIDATGVITTDSTGFTAFVWDVASGDWDVVTFNASSNTNFVKPIVTSIENTVINAATNLLIR